MVNATTGDTNRKYEYTRQQWKLYNMINSLPKPHIHPIVCLIWHFNCRKLKWICFPLIYISWNIQFTDYKQRAVKIKSNQINFHIFKSQNDTWHNTNCKKRNFFAHASVCECFSGGGGGVYLIRNNKQMKRSHVYSL